MKLFVWNRINCDYTCGMVIILAETKIQAMEVALKECARKTTRFDKESYKELAWEEPIIHELDEPLFFYSPGGS